MTDLTKYHMFSAAGETAVAEMIEELVKIIPYVPTRPLAVDALKTALRKVSVARPEVYDTEPQDAIAGAIAFLFVRRGWKPYHRFEQPDKETVRDKFFAAAADARAVVADDAAFVDLTKHLFDAYLRYEG